MNKAIGTGSIDRSARVRRIKRVIIGLVLVAVLLPTILCILLFFKVGKLEDEIADLSLKKETIKVVTDSTLIKQPYVAQPDAPEGQLTVENIYNENVFHENVYHSISEADMAIERDKKRASGEDSADAANGRGRNKSIDGSDSVIVWDDDIAADAAGQIADIENKHTGGRTMKTISIDDGYVSSSGPVFDEEGNFIYEPGKVNGSGITVDNRVGGDSNDDSDKKVKKVYLTFDDGPSSNTHRILDILDEYGVKGTFFVVGRLNDATSPLYKRIVDEGHTLGMHSYSHKYNEIYASEDAFLYDIEKIQTLIYEQTGVMPHYYRFPGGSSNKVSKVPVSKLKKLLSDRGIIYYDWNVSSGDATATYGLSKDAIVRNCISASAGKDEVMILMHDLPEKVTTTEALPEVIEYFQSIGAEILPIDETSRQFLHDE